MDRLTEMANSSDSDDGKVLIFDDSPRALKSAEPAMVLKSPNDELEEDDEDLFGSAGEKNKKKRKLCATSSNQQETDLDHDELKDKQISEICCRLADPGTSSNSFNKLRKGRWPIKRKLPGISNQVCEINCWV